MAFLSENFLFQGKSAGRLFHEYAESEPILDYHCHLSAREIAENHRFRDLTEIWLEGDHYKWRAMRANGVAERYCTGRATPREKFLAWARTVPYTLRNPLYHWTHLELQRYFGISELLDETTAPAIWDEANRQLQGDELSAQGILKKFDVRTLCTTDDPAESLEYHEQLQQSDCATAVLPAFRPDNALRIHDPQLWNGWLQRLGRSANMEIRRFEDLLTAIAKRHDDFHQLGCRLSDHGLDFCPADACSDAEAELTFQKARAGEVPRPEEAAKFAGYMMLFFGRLDAEKGWTKQLHLGAYRNANTRMTAALGRDTGFDAIADWPQIASLTRYLDRLDQEEKLPKLIIYNLNPADNYAFAAAIGNFQDSAIPGKIQFGSGWWFLDQKEGIELQLNALSNCGLLSRFVGMTTDSRSFMSYPRHEYFRRVLCNLVGNEVDQGLLPQDLELVGKMVRNICFRNAETFFAFPSGEERSRLLETSAK